jgi:CubicO group peptidase (beta-lactamase class C family)
MSLVWTADETHMSSVASVLLGAAGLVPLVLALGDPATTPQPLHAESDAPSRRRAPGARGARGHGGTATRVRPRTALQVAACLLNADVPWGTAQVAVERVNAGEVDVPVLVEWLESFGETATVFALLAGMGTDDLRAVLSGREHLDLASLRLLAQVKGEI